MTNRCVAAGAEHFRASFVRQRRRRADYSMGAVHCAPAAVKPAKDIGMKPSRLCRHGRTAQSQAARHAETRHHGLVGTEITCSRSRGPPRRPHRYAKQWQFGRDASEFSFTCHSACPRFSSGLARDMGPCHQCPNRPIWRLSMQPAMQCHQTTRASRS
jgi:hypothetical protein